MKLRNWLTLGGFTLGSIGVASAINSFLPHPFVTDQLFERASESASLAKEDWPDIDITFLRCGSVAVPECIAVRGSFSLTARTIAYSAVLIKHPRGTFLYDSGLCADTPLFLMDQSFLFSNTLGRFNMERPLCQHLEHLHMEPKDLDFVLLSHLHWDHVSGIPDLPGVLLQVNQVEYDFATQGLLEKNQGLVRRLLSNNPMQLLDFAGPAYEGFRCSHDVFGDGSIILVPLPGHTPGQMGMFINRAHGPRVFLVGDAAWLSDNYTVPTTMHPVLWSMVTSDDATARQTLIDLHHFARQHPEVAVIGMHDARMQEAFMTAEQKRLNAQIV
ncbi:MBL fold metallo-hydrolase [Dictyobacter aurantiacus]|uniref:MBL fold metallo-hydrolase n=1 Tax=Dictyobacter aurantiacus TaxID=1936993 RepID=A0A401ZAT3_9CHLR|nr:MBL fold metallo-hydrolase [Dictyobacter aurantiacus]GCE03942.1 MBL fold metallo-hydrolase [Dictyobacter aurantiacus]